MGVALGASPDPISASSKSTYESGYDHGCDDSELKAEDRYINEPGKGASFHTDEFMDGYRTGYQECKEGNSNEDTGGDADPKKTGADCWENGDFVGEDECDTGGLPLCSENDQVRCFDEADFPDED